MVKREVLDASNERPWLAGPSEVAKEHPLERDELSSPCQAPAGTLPRHPATRHPAPLLPPTPPPAKKPDVVRTQRKSR